MIFIVKQALLTNMKLDKNRLCIFAAVLIALSSCAGKHSAGNSDFKTVNVEKSDTLRVGTCFAKAVVEGEYPVADGVLSDSIVYWLASFTDIDTEVDDIRLSVSELPGKEYAEVVVTNYLYDAETDFEAMPNEELQYELNMRFGMNYADKKFVTYFANIYKFYSGAHGCTDYVAQTFLAADGHRLSASDIFADPDSPELIEIVCEALKDQYFAKKDQGKDPVDIAEILLVKPENLTLPSNPPYLVEDGVGLTYQQYEIAPYVYGLPSVVLPYARVERFMTSSVKELIKK